MRVRDLRQSMQSVDFAEIEIGNGFDMNGHVGIRTGAYTAFYIATNEHVTFRESPEEVIPVDITITVTHAKMGRRKLKN